MFKMKKYNFNGSNSDGSFNWAGENYQYSPYMSFYAYLKK